MRLGIPRVGVVWPETVGEADRAELQCFVPRDTAILVEAVDSPADKSGGITLEFVLKMAGDPNIEAAAQKLAGEGACAVAYACTSGSYVRGFGGDTEIADRMGAISGVRVTTTSTATVRALRHLGVRRVAVLSPHVDALNERLHTFLEGSGFEVVRLVGLNKVGAIELIPPISTRAIVETQVDSGDADGIFISCTSVRTASIIHDLEQALGKPVVSANQATMWEVLRLAKCFSPMLGLGRLYAERAPGA